MAIPALEVQLVGDLRPAVNRKGPFLKVLVARFAAASARGGPVAQWIRRRSTEPEIVGSSPTWIIFVFHVGLSAASTTFLSLAVLLEVRIKTSRAVRCQYQRSVIV